MTMSPAGLAPNYDDGEEISLFALANVLLRWRWLIIGLAILGAAGGVVSGLMKTREYSSSAIFIPQGAESQTSGFALAASQFGISVPSSGGGWGPPMYVELIRSRALLTPIVFDTLVVAEERGRRVTFMDLMQISGPTPDRRAELAANALSGMIAADEDKKLSAVTFSVTTRWPSVSLALAQKLVERVNQFNLETRKSQAAAERKFVDTQTAQAEDSLRNAENKLQQFLQDNRQVGSPQQLFERDRLQREVTMRQQLYASWLQNGEDARIREVRDTPVITVMEEPRLPFVGQPRGTGQKMVLGGIAGALIGALIAFLASKLSGARAAETEEAREFFELVDDATPRFLRRNGRVRG
jgi:uncharacterized protein involved in exopolysaccharide biosynthesis